MSNWRNDLKTFILFHSLEPMNQKVLDSIESSMKLFYPGEYHLEWVKSNDVRVVFEDKHQELIWLLKNS